MKQYLLLLIFLITFQTHAYSEEKSYFTDHTISTNKVDKESIATFNKIIIPWLQFKFKEDLSDDISLVERKLIFKELFRFENIENQDRYYVHIEFVHKIADKTSDIQIFNLSGQEIIFWIDGTEIKDYFPFDAYVIKQEIEGDNYEEVPVQQFQY